jgi:hypothetical protein
MIDKFKQQLEDNKLVTEEMLEQIKNKTYHNGDEIKVGDKLLFGMTLHEDENKHLSVTLIALNENQIDLYETDDRHRIADTKLPIIKLK